MNSRRFVSESAYLFRLMSPPQELLDMERKAVRLTKAYKIGVLYVIYSTHQYTHTHTHTH